MSSFLRKITALLLPIAIVLGAAGCATENNSQYIGTWECIHAEMAGVELDIAAAFTDAPVLRISEDKKAELTVNGDTRAYSWSEEEEYIALRSGTNEDTGYYYDYDGTLEFYSLMGMELTFVRQGSTSPAEVLPEVSAEPQSSLSGVWTSVGVKSDGKLIDSFWGFDVKGLLVLTLGTDGVASVTVFDDTYTGAWEQTSDTGGTVSTDGGSMPFSYDGEYLSFTYSGAVFCFERTEAN